MRLVPRQGKCLHELSWFKFLRRLQITPRASLFGFWIDYLKNPPQRLYKKLPGFSRSVTRIVKLRLDLQKAALQSSRKACDGSPKEPSDSLIAAYRIDLSIMAVLPFEVTRSSITKPCVGE